MSKVRKLKLGDLTTCTTNRDDGSILLSALPPLEPYPTTMLDRLIYWAEATPDKLFIAQRDPGNRKIWQKLTYRETLESVRRVASALSQYPLSQERPIAILSGNSNEHALIGFAAMYLGIPYAPISPQYSLTSTDFFKLKHVIDLITPGMIFVDDALAYEKAITFASSEDVVVVSCKGFLADRKCVLFNNLVTTPIDDIVETRYRNIKPDDVAKFLFSSGSTGSPKAVVNTHRMLTANQQMIVQSYPFLKKTPVLVDWLPWNHTFGGNHNFGIALYNGGSYYIDDGKPVPVAFMETVRNLKEIAPTAYFNVPKGFELLVKYLQEDKELCETFFSRVKMLFYAGAGISQPVWDALEEISLAHCDERIMILTGLGCTETAPSALFTNTDEGFAGWLGLPLPGVQVKLRPVGEKLEICFRGDSVAPGYWRNPELTAKAFDEEGYYLSGDAVKFADIHDPQKGLVFDGRISEDFKLDTGTWVSAGPLRAQFLNHCGRLVKDVVIVGRDHSSVGALVFPDMDYCRTIVSEMESVRSLSDEEMLEQEIIIMLFEELLNSFALNSTGSASRIERVLLQHVPLSIDKHEITDKGSLNSSAIQNNRKNDIDLMYQKTPSPKLIQVYKR